MTPPEDRATEIPPSERQSLSRMLRDLANDASNLIRQEIGLARAEIRSNVKSLVARIGQLALGGGLALVGLLVLVAFLVVGLGALLGGEYWLSALIVAITLLGGGAGLAYLGVQRLAAKPLVPTTTIQSLKETGEWAAREAGDFGAALGGDAESTTRSVALAAPPGKAVSVPAGERSVTHTPRERPGRKAPPPSTAPFHKRLLHEIQEDEVPGRAAQVAFFTFTSLPPALLVIFALTGIFGGEGITDFITSRMQGVLPGSADEPDSAAGFISRFVEQVVNENAPGPLSIGLLTGLWASSAVFVALTDALNVAYDLEDGRSWFRKRAMAVGVMVAFALLFICGSVVLVAGPTLAETIQLGGVANILWSILQWPLAFALVVAAFFLVYYVLPDRDQSLQKRALLRGSAIAAGLWLVATFGFRIYITNFGSYSATYGFVGAILVLLLWMYITGLVILIGGEISSEMEREARR